MTTNQLAHAHIIDLNATLDAYDILAKLHGQINAEPYTHSRLGAMILLSSAMNRLHHRAQTIQSSLRLLLVD